MYCLKTMFHRLWLFKFSLNLTLIYICDMVYNVPSTVATIATGQPSYSVTEYEDQQLNFNIVLTGQKGPGRSCVVTVSTLDDSATGRYSFIHKLNIWHGKSTA